MPRSEHSIYNREFNLLIPNALEIELDKEAFSIARASFECKLHVAVKSQYSQAFRHKIVTNAEVIEQVP